MTNFSSFAHMYFRDDYWSWTCHTLPWKFENIQWISQYPSIFILPSVYKVCSLSVCITFYTTKLIELKKFSVLFFVCLFVFCRGVAVHVCALFSIWEMENLASVSVSQLVSLDDSGICYHMKLWTRKGRMKANQGIHLAWIFLQCMLISNRRWSW